MNPGTLNEYLGPALGFLFTTGTILFIALNAHKTARPQAQQAAAATEENGN